LAASEDGQSGQLGFTELTVAGKMSFLARVVSDRLPVLVAFGA